MANLDCGFFTDGQEQTIQSWRRYQQGATPFVVAEVQPNMMILSMLVQCQGVEGQEAIKETVESLNSLGYFELTVRLDTDPAMRSFRDAMTQRAEGSVLVHQHMIPHHVAKWRMPSNQ